MQHVDKHAKFAPAVSGDEHTMATTQTESDVEEKWLNYIDFESRCMCENIVK